MYAHTRKWSSRGERCIHTFVPEKDLISLLYGHISPSLVYLSRLLIAVTTMTMTMTMGEIRRVNGIFTSRTVTMHRQDTLAYNNIYASGITRIAIILHCKHPRDTNQHLIL